LTVTSGVDANISGPNSTESAPESSPVLREVAARIPGPSPIEASRIVRSGSFLGLGGDYIGRPAPGGPLGTPAPSTSQAGGTAPQADAVGPLQEIGPPSGSMGGHILGRSVPRGDRIVGRGADPAAPDDGTTIVDAGLEELLGDGPTRPAGEWAGRSEDAITDFLEPGPPGVPSDGLPAEGSFPTERAATGMGRELARVEESRSLMWPVSIGLAVSLVIRLRRRDSHISGRLRGWKPAWPRPSIPQQA
jgi:hypothetical protein